jgi:hypothetical protein
MCCGSIESLFVTLGLIFLGILSIPADQLLQYIPPVIPEHNRVDFQNFVDDYRSAILYPLIVILSFWLLSPCLLQLQSCCTHSRLRAKVVSLSRKECNLAELPLAKLSEARVSTILGMNVTQLAESLQRGELTSVEIVSVYIRQADSVGRKLNAVTSECFAEALQTAAQVDAARRARAPTSSNSEGLSLEGIPISIKDCYTQQGQVASVGLLGWAARAPARADGAMIALLRKAGAIPFVRTNVPPILMAWETDNFVYGRTLNPWNRERVAGGR